MYLELVELFEEKWSDIYVHDHNKGEEVEPDGHVQDPYDSIYTVHCLVANFSFVEVSSDLCWSFDRRQVLLGSSGVDEIEYWVSLY